MVFQLAFLTFGIVFLFQVTSKDRLRLLKISTYQAFFTIVAPLALVVGALAFPPEPGTPIGIAVVYLLISLGVAFIANAVIGLLLGALLKSE